jgi:hypothetical protein
MSFSKNSHGMLRAWIKRLDTKLPEKSPKVRKNQKPKKALFRKKEKKEKKRKKCARQPRQPRV